MANVVGDVGGVLERDVCGIGEVRYVAADSTKITSCVGYFAYFSAAEELRIPTALVNDPLSPPGLTVQCPLQAGWNTVGNPLNNMALLPAGTTGFWWDPQAQAYQVVHQIGWGSAVWVHSPAPSELTLTGV